MLQRLPRFLSALGTTPRSPAARIGALVGGSFLFLVVVPILLGLVGRAVARAVSLSVPRSLEIAIAIPVAGLGLIILDWAAWVFWRAGDGTPVPTAAPQRLVVSGPYRYCRNPIQLGAICYFFGIGCVVLSLVAGLAMCLIGLVVGSVYHKWVEEPALVLRFGPAYEAYRRKTPFLIPRLSRGRGSGPGDEPAP